MSIPHDILLFFTFNAHAMCKHLNQDVDYVKLNQECVCKLLAR
jgi:hypothetical protein